MPDPNAPVTLTIPASAARLSADALYQAARDARDAGEVAIANCYETAATELHAAGWTQARTLTHD